MAISYSVTPRKNPKDIMSPPKYYANAQSTSVYNIEAMSAEIEKHCTVSEADIYAVLKAAVFCMQQALKRGESIKIDDLGTFRVGLSSEGTLTEQEFNAGHIKSARITFIASRRLKDTVRNFQFKKVSPRPQKSEEDDEGGGV